MFNHFYEKKDQHRCTLYIGEALGRPKDPGAASGRLKILYDYILNNSKILLDTFWNSYSNRGVGSELSVAKKPK